ncbi:hypothetical protein WICPIJ_009658 [Wickerhamomyces pijperi]|uniref:U3 small nucleolar RNA-associated protein 25 n=1 Tax=Wickerhamomyces pijperi TaxID=599730 RepID=A0A9P8PKE1_WICPI|nr:hypothetical protein WICPIJ_009658 [Wickerhamomyces pijperi]
MVASQARKERRSQGDNNASKDRFANAANEERSHKRQKIRNRGRTEYRNVTRSASRRSNVVEEEQAEIDDFPDHTESEDESENEAAQDEEKGKAYDALMTLLAAENEEDEEESEEDEEEENSEQENDEDSKEEEKEEGADSEEEEPEQIAGLITKEEQQSDEELDEEVDSEEDEDNEDPFEYHFAHSDEKYLSDSISSLGVASKWKNVKRQFETHSCITSTPPFSQSSQSQLYKTPTSHSLSNYKIKQKALESFLLQEGNAEAADNSEIFQMLLDPVFSYQDVLYPYNSYSKIPDYRKLYTLHAVNHVLKTRDRVIKNNTKLSIQREKLKNGEMDIRDEVEFRDQGFTRPRVLVLLPSRNQCYKVVMEMIKYAKMDQIENLKRFKAEFLEEDMELPEGKPDDFKDLFEGNTNDFFCLGLKFTRKSAKLYASFFTADIIFASPIGLQMILEHPDKKKRQTDFLSSIEMFIVDQAQAMEMQNWDHILTILKHLNKIPKDLNDTDFSRVRMWNIEDQAKFFTQSLIFAEYITPNVSNLLTKSMNIFGKHRFRSIIPIKDSAMFKMGLKIKQIFTRFASTSPMEEPNERFNHFKSVIVPSLSKSTTYEDGLLLYIPSYTDFVRVRNYLKAKTSLSFTDVNEYTSMSETSRAMTYFRQGRKKIMLYTERLHHFRRFKLRGVKNIIMYGVPSNPLFYDEIVSSIGRSVYDETADFNISNVRVMYSKWDAMALERVVGSERAPVLTHGQNEFYEFR